MYRRFASHVELRMDRRLTLLMLLGGLVWTLLTFFFGVMVGGTDSQQGIRKRLSGMGWMTLEKYRVEELCKQKNFASGLRKVSTQRPGSALSPRSQKSDWSQRKKLASRWKKLAIAPPTRIKKKRKTSPKSSQRIARAKRPVVKRAVAKPKPRNKLAPAPRKKASRVEKKRFQQRYGFVSHSQAKYTLFVRARSSYKSLRKIRGFFRRKGYDSMLQLRSSRKGRRYVMTSGRFRNRSAASRFQRLLRRRHGFRTRIVTFR